MQSLRFSHSIRNLPACSSMQHLTEILYQNHELRGFYNSKDLVQSSEKGLSALQASSLFASMVEGLCDRHVVGVCKDEGESLRWKEQASNLFKQGRFNEAAETYGLALRHQPAYTDKERMVASVLHANRALCLSKFTPPGANHPDDMFDLVGQRLETWLSGSLKAPTVRYGRGGGSGQ